VVWLIHQSADVVRKYGNPVPGFDKAPKAWVSVKLPIGVADKFSFGCVVIPCEPMWAGIGDPCLSQPPPGALTHACTVAVVLLVLLATTVSTRVAPLVLPAIGNATPRTGAGADEETDVVAAGVGEDTCDVLGAAELDADVLGGLLLADVLGVIRALLEAGATVRKSYAA